METVIAVFEVVVSSVWLFVIKDYFEIFLEKRNHKKRTEILIWVLYFLYETISGEYIHIMIFRPIHAFINMLLVCHILYEGGKKQKLMVIAGYIGITFMIECLLAFILLLSKADIIAYDVFGWTATKITTLMVVNIIKALNIGKAKTEISASYWLAVFLIPIGGIVIVYNILILTLQNRKMNMLVTSMFSAVIVLAQVIIMFVIYEKLAKEAEITKKNVVFKQQLELYKRQNEEREISLKNIRKFRHDFKNHLICLSKYAREGKYKELNNYIENLMKEQMLPNKNDMIQSGNITIDALLNYKISKAAEYHIEIKNEIAIPNKLAFEDSDICVILGNSLDNAIEAVQKVSENKRVIEFTMRYHQGNLIIYIKNPYEGNIKTDKRGCLKTSKQNGEHHGIGISSMKSAADKYHGLVELHYENHEFELQILLYAPENNV